MKYTFSEGPVQPGGSLALNRISQRLQNAMYTRMQSDLYH